MAQPDTSPILMGFDGSTSRATALSQQVASCGHTRAQLCVCVTHGFLLPWLLTTCMCSRPTPNAGSHMSTILDKMVRKFSTSWCRVTPVSILPKGLYLYSTFTLPLTLTLLYLYLYQYSISILPLPLLLYLCLDFYLYYTSASALPLPLSLPLTLTLRLPLLLSLPLPVIFYL